MKITFFNRFLVNHGQPSLAIVLGISGKVKELVNMSLVKQDNIPMIKRYSGGGTVIVDKSTYFTTFIVNVINKLYYYL